MEEVLSGVKNIYLVGIGGVGMSGLALLLKDKGFTVMGSDSKEGSNVKMLKEAGIKVFIGHKKEHITSDIHILGYSSAVREDNPELLAAKKNSISIFKRGRLLAWLCKGKKTIAVAGSHGKTTTSSLLTHILTCLNYKPTVFVGGLPLNYSKGAWWGEDYFVVETDESDGSFLYFNPWVSIITNIDNEHLDYYQTPEALENSFLEFASKTNEKVFGWGDQNSVSKILSQTGGVSFGWNEGNLIRGVNFRFEGGKNTFDLYVKEDFITSVKTHLVGKCNCLNILAALSFFYYIGEDLEKVNEALRSFKGTKRRFEVKEKAGGVTFIDDYAHHPTEIKAILSAARMLNPKRLLVILQPHRFSRVKLLYSEFSKSLANADKVIVTDIYSAHEDNPQKVNVRELAKAISRDSSVQADYIPRKSFLKDIPFYFEDGDLVLALGAGDINILMERAIDEFKKNVVSSS